MAVRQTVLLYADEMKKKSPAFKNFTRGINTQATLSDYSDYLRLFMKFHKMGDDYDKVVKSDTKIIDDMLSDYLDSLIDRNLKGITQRAHLMGIERLFIMNDCIWHKDRIRKSITKDDEIPGGTVPVTSGEIYAMLKCTKSLRTHAFVHFLATTGARPAGMTDPILRIKHLEVMMHSKDKCYAVKIYDGSKSGYWAFFTPEATNVIDQWLEFRKNKGEVITPESALFTTIQKTNTKNLHLTDANARFIMYDLIKNSGMKREKVSPNRYDKAVMYMFRKRFNTILKLENDLNSNIAEKLMAHKKGLDGTYLQPTRDECFIEFVKAIPELTIDPTERQRLIISKKQDEITELEEKNQKLEEREKEIIELKKKHARHDILLEKLSDEKKRDTRQEPSDDLKKVMLELLKEHNLL